MSSHFQGSHYRASHYLSSHYVGLLSIQTDPDVIHPIGSDPHQRALRARILIEDEEILAVVVAFMQIKDD